MFGFLYYFHQKIRIDTIFDNLKIINCPIQGLYFDF